MIMNSNKLKRPYEHLQTDALMTMDLMPYWHTTVPTILSESDLICNDGTKAIVYLIIDIAMSGEGRDAYLCIDLRINL